MPRPAERSKKKKHKKTPTRTKTIYVRGKSSKHSCGLCGKELHGVPHSKKPAEVKKLSKSARRPSGMFGGVLCSGCREKMFEEAAKIEAGAKTIEETPYNGRAFIEQALERRK